MAQYIEGTVDVTNGSAVVTGTGTAWLANVTAGDLFLVSGGSAAIVIQTVDSDAQITLAANFAGGTDIGLNYSIHREFSPGGFPLMRPGDVFFDQIWARMVLQLEAILAGGITISGTFPVWHALSSGPPSAGLGNDGDLAIIANGDIYTKASGAWSLFTNIAFSIPALTSVTTMLGTDEMVIQTGSGPRRITRDNAMPRRNNFPTFAAQDVNLANDFLWAWDGTDNAPYQISFLQALFGNFRNVFLNSLASALTLAVDDHANRVLQLSGTWTDPTINLDGAASNIDGANFYFMNYTTDDFTLEAINGLSLLVDGASASSAIIRAGFPAAVNVNNGPNDCIFYGG